MCCPISSLTCNSRPAHRRKADFSGNIRHIATQRNAALVHRTAFQAARYKGPVDLARPPDFAQSLLQAACRDLVMKRHPLARRAGRGRRRHRGACFATNPVRYADYQRTFRTAHEPELLTRT